MQKCDKIGHFRCFGLSMTSHISKTTHRIFITSISFQRTLVTLQVWGVKWKSFESFLRKMDFFKSSQQITNFWRFRPFWPFFTASSASLSLVTPSSSLLSICNNNTHFFVPELTIFIVKTFTFLPFLVAFHDFFYHFLQIDSY